MQLHKDLQFNDIQRSRAFPSCNVVVDTLWTLILKNTRRTKDAEYEEGECSRFALYGLPRKWFDWNTLMRLTCLQTMWITGVTLEEITAVCSETLSDESNSIYNPSISIVWLEISEYISVCY